MYTRVSHNVRGQVLKDNVKNGSSCLPWRSLLALLCESMHSPHQLHVWSGAGMASGGLQFSGELALHVKVLKAICTSTA